MIRSGFQRRYCRAREVKLPPVLVLVGDGSLPWTAHIWGGGARYHTDEVWAMKRACKVGRETIRDSARAPAKRDRASSISLARSQLSSLMRKESVGYDRLRTLPSSRYCWISWPREKSSYKIVHFLNITYVYIRVYTELNISFIYSKRLKRFKILVD